jgi:hypothetical protein
MHASRASESAYAWLGRPAVFKGGPGRLALGTSKSVPDAASHLTVVFYTE